MKTGETFQPRDAIGQLLEVGSRVSSFNLPEKFTGRIHAFDGYRVGGLLYHWFAEMTRDDTGRMESVSVENLILENAAGPSSPKPSIPTSRVGEVLKRNDRVRTIDHAEKFSGRIAAIYKLGKDESWGWCAEVERDDTGAYCQIMVYNLVLEKSGGTP